MTMRKFTLILLGLFTVLSCSLEAQSLKIFGYVYDQNKSPVADWTVTVLTDPATNTLGARVLTNRNGFYEIELKLNPNVKEYLVQVVDPCANAPQVQRVPNVEGKEQRDFVICATSNPKSDPCEGKFSYTVHPDGWVEFHAVTASNIRAEFIWNFGDGTTGNGQDVRHQYEKAGSYEVVLIIAGVNCKFRISQKIDVKRDSAPADRWENACCGKVNIGSVALNSSAGKVYIFTASAAFPIKEVHWDFGDGSTGSGIEVKHSYANDGKYLVTTTIVGEFCKVQIQTWIQAGSGSNPRDCDIDFKYSADQLLVKFGADFKGITPDKIRWDFGDGNGSSDANTLHTYAKEGVYKVTLTISVNGKICTISKEIKVSGRNTNTPCSADFDFGIDGLSVKLAANFKGQTADKFKWDLGDGNTSSDLSLRHTYAKAGTYTITLYYVINGTECKVSKTIRVGSRLTGGGITIELYEISPNPVVENTTISIKSSDKAMITLVITDLRGNGLLKSQYELEPGDNKIPLSLKDLKAGSYLVNVYYENKIVTKGKFLKL